MLQGDIAILARSVDSFAIGNVAEREVPAQQAYWLRTSRARSNLVNLGKYCFSVANFKARSSI